LDLKPFADFAVQSAPFGTLWVPRVCTKISCTVCRLIAASLQIFWSRLAAKWRLGGHLSRFGARARIAHFLRLTLHFVDTEKMHFLRIHGVLHPHLLWGRGLVVEWNFAENV